MQASKAVHAVITNTQLFPVDKTTRWLIHKQYCGNGGLVTSETMYTENKRLRCTRQKRLFFLEIRAVHHRCRKGCERKQTNRQWFTVGEMFCTALKRYYGVCKILFILISAHGCI